MGIDKAELLKSLRKLPIPEFKMMKSLNELKNCLGFCEILFLIHKKRLQKGISPELHLEKHLPQQLKHKTRALNIENICEIAQFLLLQIPNKVPKLKLPLPDSSSLTTHYTLRSYLNTYKQKTTFRSQTPQNIKKKSVPEVLMWVYSLGYTENVIEKAREGNFFCVLINLLEKKSVIKGFFDPAKSNSAVKVNFNKAFTFLTGKKMCSEYFNIKEIQKGNEKTICGLLTDIKNFYIFQLARLEIEKEKENKKDFISENLKNLGISSLEKVNQLEIGEYLLSFIGKFYKICVPLPLPSVTLENSKQNLLKFFIELVKVNPGVYLKYADRAKELINNKSTVDFLIRDILQSSKLSQIDGDFLSWMRKIGLSVPETTLKDLLPRVKTGELLSELVELLTHKTFPFSTSPCLINSLENISTALETLFSHGLIPHQLKSESHNLYTGEISSLKLLLNSLKSATRLQTDLKPTECNSKLLNYRSVTPPPYFSTNL